MKKEAMSGRGALQGRVALVAGASRGIGRGIAQELGAAGATVYVTGRTRAGRPSADGTPGTIDETAALVEEAGGEGIAIACDHTDAAAVEQLARTVREHHGGLDLLVNAVWGGYEHYDPDLFARLPWDQSLERWDKMVATGLRAPYITARALLPLMAGRERPLVVNLSAGDDGRFLGDAQYDVVKASVDRLGFALGRRLRDEGITVLTIHPGMTWTERVERHAPAEVRVEGHTHSPRYVGRAVVALATDPQVARRTGGVFKAATLGDDYGFTDVDGRRPVPFRLPPEYA